VGGAILLADCIEIARFRTLHMPDRRHPEYRKPERDPRCPATSRLRRCLMCGSRFDSAWSGERICRSCKTKSVWRTGAVAIRRNDRISECRRHLCRINGRAVAAVAQEAIVMRRHRFIDGQVIDARPNPCATLAGAYEIVCRLPMNGGDHQYWVRSLKNDGHRVARESDLIVASG
jgi:hypothetical protein